MIFAALLMLKLTQQIRHVTLPFGIDHTTYWITCSHEIIKAGKAPAHCQFLCCFIVLALWEQAKFRSSR